MQEIFIKIINMSISAGWIVIAVMLLRLALKKAPKRAVIFLWAIVAVRLVCPFSPESVLSLIPSAETVPADIVYSEAPEIQSGVPALDSAVNSTIYNNLKPDASESVNPAQTAVTAAAALWIAGIAAMLVYALVSVLKIRGRVREAVKYRDNIWLCDRISTPFIFGVFRPAVYIPFSLPEKDAEYVIAHEEAHLKRHDHILKPFAFLLLCVYWFNPLLWAAYVLFCRDIELSCDEAVIEAMEPEKIKEYTSALLECSAPARRISPCPLAFGESGVKGRIKAALKYRKPAVWAAGAAGIVIIATAAVFLTSPVKKEFSPDGHDWTFRCVQDGENGAILYCPESESDVYPDAEIREYSLNMKKDSFSLLSSLEPEGEGSSYSFERISKKPDGNIYEISGNGETGYMSVGKTEYYGGTAEYTLIITVGGRSYYFYELDRGDTPMFDAVVTETHENYILIEPLDNEAEAGSVISISQPENYGLPASYRQTGSKIRVFYSGEILTIYPSTLHKIYAIYPLGNQNGATALYNASSGTDCAGIEYSCQYIVLDKESPYITVKWSNRSDDSLCFGDEFRLLKDGKPCKLRNGYSYGSEDILYTMFEKGTYTENYYLEPYDISAEGDYRLEKEFYLESNPDKKYTAYVEFEIETNKR